ncbi:hypothetical protein N7470_003847 [Penicillium chermesinum]|nr:hypothetical protein N7470_003847 [Penicillium chermesinum]
MYKRHPDFEKVQASRPDFRANAEVNTTKTPNPAWKQGDGGNDGGESLKKDHIEINPYAEGRPAALNYKLLISSIVPRPIALVSTVSADGKSFNLAPFSYSQVVCHDPPTFIVGFAGPLEQAKDTLKNLNETKECVINIISEHFVEAANSTSVNAPYGQSEWKYSGLHQAPTSIVKPPRVKESVFSVEAKLQDIKEFESRTTGQKTGAMVIVEGVRFWAREDAINEEQSIIDVNVLKPVSRLGGITYGRVTEIFELQRPEW